jgi:hypothetical protein
VEVVQVKMLRATILLANQGVRVVVQVQAGLWHMRALELLIREIMVDGVICGEGPLSPPAVSRPLAVAVVLVPLEEMHLTFPVRCLLMVDLAGMGIQKEILYTILMGEVLLLFPHTLRMVEQISLMLAVEVVVVLRQMLAIMSMLLEELVVAVMVFMRGTRTLAQPILAAEAVEAADPVLQSVAVVMAAQE